MLTLGTATLNRYDLLAEMIASAEAGTRPPDRYFLVDNGRQFIQKYFDVGHPIRSEIAIHQPEKNGVATAFNHIFNNNEDIIICTNDDVRFEPDTLERMERAALEDPERLFIVPEAGAGAAFTLFLARKKLFELVGWFDEQFTPAYFEDNDFAYRMQLAGVGRYHVPAKYFHHKSATLAKFNLQETLQHHKDFKKNRDYYISKWGGPPGEEKWTTPHL